MHYSGHGTQLPSRGEGYGTLEECDHLDESLVLDDLFLLVDDDLKTFFSRLPTGVHATVMMDCCHSGTMLDGSTIVISGDNNLINEEEADSDEEQSERIDKDFTIEARSLSIDTVCEEMTHKLGKPVSPNGVRSAQAAVFGAHAGKFMYDSAMGTLETSGDIGMKQRREITSLMATAATRFSDEIESVSGKKADGSLGGMITALQKAGLAGVRKEEVTSAPPFDPWQTASVSDDTCALITGCEASELSPDVRRWGKVTAVYHCLGLQVHQHRRWQSFSSHFASRRR